MKTKKLTACIMAAMMLFAVMFSVFFITVHADHDCTGEDCPVCAVIHQCENIIHGLGDGGAAVSAVLIPIAALSLFVSIHACFFAGDTPVSRKVRLNN
ncbi:MAG: hypothetical protein K5668_11945 [Lachnospiraceae bacterium]|nr:hypothetical protein [Lachnospiraceae bacterium]